MPTLEDAIKEAYASCPTSKVILETLEIKQTGVQSPIYIVKSRQGITANDEIGRTIVFRPCGFQITLPAQNEDGFRSLNIAVDNVGREITDFVTTAMSQNVPVEVVYRPYLSDDLTRPQMNPPLVLYLKELQVNAFQVTGRATFMDLVNRKFPTELYTRARFPALQ